MMVAMKDKSERVNRAKPVHGEYVEAGGVGWRHGRRPQCPAGLGRQAQSMWRLWFGSWFAWFWEPEDLAGLRMLIRAFDAVEKAGGSASIRSQEHLLRLMDQYGITPAGQQARRWKRPSGVSPVSASADAAPAPARGGRYSGLVVVSSDDVAAG